MLQPSFTETNLNRNDSRCLCSSAAHLMCLIPRASMIITSYAGYSEVLDNHLIIDQHEHYEAFEGQHSAMLIASVTTLSLCALQYGTNKSDKN